MELLFSIETGSFPLYSPGYALGQTSMALAWSQIFHPISYLASIMPGYWSGKALLWYTFFKLLSLGFTQIILFVFLRKIKVNAVFSFLISLITVYNLRMLDMFRFGPALEAYTAHLLLCAAIGWYFIHPSKLLGPLGIIFTTYLLVVSGHPQMMYYGLLGAGLFLLIVPFFIPDMAAEKHIDFKGILTFYVKSVIFIAVGIVLSSIYILPFYFDFYKTNAGRVGSSYEWSSQGTQSFFGVLSNFLVPFLSDVHGAFGGASIILLAALLPLLRCFRIRVPRSVWIIWGIVLFLFLYMLGQGTPIHRWAWEYLPFMSAFRNPGRVSMIIPVFLMMLLAWIVKSDEPVMFLKRRSVKLTPYAVLASIALLLIPLYALIFFLFRPPLGFLPPISLHKIPFLVLAFVLCSGILSLLLLIAYGTYQRASHIIGGILCLVVILQTGALLRYGTFIIPVKDRPTFEQMMSQKREKLDYRHHDLPGMQNSAVITQLDHSFIEPFLGRIFTLIVPVKSQDDAYDRMARERVPQQLFIEGYDPEKAKEITEAARYMKEGTVELAYSSFNRLTFHVASQEPAFFGLSYPYTGNWRGWVNGKRVHVYRANGAAHAVEIPAGQSMVEFRYWSSAFFWGMLISCTTFAIIGVFACFRGLIGLPRITGVVLIIIASAGVFMLWYNSLYNGDNLHTEYSWTYTPPTKTPNLAYGKKTSGYELPSTSYLQYHRSRAVDGDTRSGSGFTFEPNNGKELIVDLSRNEEIAKILLYGKSNTFPLILLSQDGYQWDNALSLSSGAGNGEHVFRIDFEKAVTARFVKIIASDSPVSIDELEVYGPTLIK